MKKIYIELFGFTLLLNLYMEFDVYKFIYKRIMRKY